MTREKNVKLWIYTVYLAIEKEWKHIRSMLPITLWLEKINILSCPDLLMQEFTETSSLKQANVLILSRICENCKAE